MYYEVNSLKQPLHILHLEESDKDSELIRSYLAAAGMACEVTKVETRRRGNSAINAAGTRLRNDKEGREHG